MNSPATYAEWAACCDRLLNTDADDDILAAMEGGHLEWTSGVAERITRRIYEVFDHKLKALAEEFHRDAAHSHGHETLLANSLLDIRKKLVPLARLAAMPAFPEVVRQSLKQSLLQFVERTQASLESSARTDRTGRLLDIVRRNRICLSEISALPRSGGQSDPHVPATSGTKQPRRVILT